MTIRLIVSFLAAFAIAALLGTVYVPWLRKIKAGQEIKEIGPNWHKSKAGTPTMGGLIILISTAATSMLFAGKYPRIIPILFLILGFGLIGFLDDYLKVVLRRSDGLYPKQKMAGQLVVTTIFVVYLWIMDKSCLDLLIPRFRLPTLRSSAL